MSPDRRGLRVARWVGAVAGVLLAGGAAGLVVASRTAAQTAPANLLEAGHALGPGKRLWAGRFALAMRPGGNLVESVKENGAWYPAWQSHTSVPDSTLLVQSHRGVVIRTPQGRDIWAVGAGATALVLGTHGRLTAQGRGPGVLWSTPAVATRFPRLPQRAPRDLTPGEGLVAGAHLSSPPYSLAMEPSGDLVLAGPHGVIWSNHRHSRGAYLVMRRDGQLAEEDLAGQTIWERGGPGASCLMAGVTTGTKVAGFVVPGWMWPLWSVTPCYRGDLQGPKVAVVGDSIDYVSSGAIESALGRRFAYSISAQPTWTIAQQLPALAAAMDNPWGRPADVIVNLGTNNALQQNSDAVSANWRPQFRQMMDMIKHSCAVLVTINQMSDFAGGTVAAQINRAIYSAAAEHPNLHVIDWNRLLYANNAANAHKWLVDGIHPDLAGQQVLARLYAGALQRDC